MKKAPWMKDNASYTALGHKLRFLEGGKCNL
jgi:hypothetical protein